jgi:hypothetical protein
MKWFTVARSANPLALNAVLWGAPATLMLLVPAAYGQQEVDPTWYDPWAAPHKVVTQPAQPRTPNRNPKQKTTSAPHQHGQKLDAKRSASGPGKRFVRTGHRMALYPEQVIRLRALANGTLLAEMPCTSATSKAGIEEHPCRG